MARRVSWTNNSSGHTGTYVYRAPTLDPQALPAPVATVDPVAQGATAEWNDTETLAAGDYDYAVQDYDGSGVGVLSGINAHTILEDYSTAQIGDAIGGGIYAGSITYADSREFHIIFAKDSPGGLQWKTSPTSTTNTQDDYDGMANTQGMIDSGIADHPQGEYCVNYTSEGFDDWYMPAKFELALQQNIKSAPEINTTAVAVRASTERTGFYAEAIDPDTGVFLGSSNATQKDTIFSSVLVIPIRRVPV